MTIKSMIDDAERLLYAGNAKHALAVLEVAREIPAADIDRYALGEALLRASNARVGWDLYDLHPSRAVDRLPIARRWDGERCPNLVLIAEQGFGDAIQFIRYIPHIVRRVDHVVLVIHDELMDLVVSSPLLAGVKIYAKSEARSATWPPDTSWERLMSLPRHLAHEASATPAEGYLDARRSVCQVPDSRPGTWNVGVAWRSTPRRGFANR